MKNNMLGQKTLNVTKSYTYLGHIITDTLCDEADIYTAKIAGIVCPPNISETGRHMKLAHRQRIASTTIKLISKKVYCPF